MATMCGWAKYNTDVRARVNLNVIGSVLSSVPGITYYTLRRGKKEEGVGMTKSKEWVNIYVDGVTIIYRELHVGGSKQ